MQQSPKFPRGDVVQIDSRAPERARLFGEFGAVLLLGGRRKGKPVYAMDVYRRSLREYCKNPPKESDHDLAQYAIRQIETGRSGHQEKPS